MSLLREQKIDADQSTVSRWEAGRTAFPPRAVTAYENILGVQPGAFSGVGALLNSADGGDVGPWRSAPTSSGSFDDELDTLFELMATGRARGADWYRFASALPRTKVYLRQDTWQAITSSLISEFARSTKHAFAPRSGAASMLMQHPSATGPMTSQIEAFVTEQHAQVVGLPIGLLAARITPATIALIERLAASDDYATAIATASAAGSILRKDPRALDGTILSSLVVRLISHVPLDEQDFVAPSLAAQLPDDIFTSVLRQVSRAQQDRLISARRTGEVVPPGVALREARALSMIVRAKTGGLGLHEPDLMLERLLREALFGVSHGRRRTSMTLLALSPYQQAAATAMRQIVLNGRKEISSRAALTLAYLSQESDKDWILEQVRTHPSDGVVGQLLRALAYSTAPLSENDLSQLSRLADRNTPFIQSQVLTVLGLNDAVPALTKIQGGARSPELRGAAEWWLRQGGAVRDEG